MQENTKIHNTNQQFITLSDKNITRHEIIEILNHYNEPELDRLILIHLKSLIKILIK